jgi:hypothetical protein
MIVVHESRRLKPEYHATVGSLPCTTSPRSAIDAAAWQQWPRFACAVVAAVVQARSLHGGRHRARNALCRTGPSQGTPSRSDP